MRTAAAGVLGGIVLALALPSSAAPQAKSTNPRRGLGSELVVVATDFRFEAPEQVDAGLVNIRLFNRGKEHHHVLLIKVDRLDRVGQIAEQLKTNDWNVPWMHALGGPESVAPGGVASASMILEPGRYVLACVVASPSSHRQHFMDGMIRELSVVRGPVAAETTLPPAEATLKLFEWNFTLEGPLTAGRHTIRVQNVGRFEHHVSFVRLAEGKSLADAVKWAEDPKGPAPYEPVGGTTGIEAGRSVNVTLDLMPGNYALLCTLFNPLSKRTHSAHGMIKPLRISD